MKKYISLLLLFGFLFTFQNYSAQKIDQKTVDALVNSQEFTFHAQRANPINYDVINIASSLPNAPGMRIFQLDGDNYTVEIKSNSLQVDLPYFGRLFNATPGNTDKNSYRFTSKSFTVNKSKNKRGNWTIKIKINDVNNATDIIVQVSKNGKAFTSINSNDRQPISYDGYISANDPDKETSSL